MFMLSFVFVIVSRRFEWKKIRTGYVIVSVYAYYRWESNYHEWEDCDPN
jgi:hypothetical protein